VTAKPCVLGALRACTSVGVDATVKPTPLLLTPPTVTTTFPVVAQLGTGTWMLVALQLVGVPATPLKVTVLVPCVAPKFVPVTVTDVPTGPDVGDRLVMFGGGIVTVKLTPLLAAPPTVTTTFPVAAPAGTGTTMLVALQLVGVPAVPLKVTVLVPCVDPKFVPVTVTDVPTAPDVGDRLLIVGVGSTVKLTPLLATPFTVTTTFPVLAPTGTGTTMLVAFQLVGVPALPLNVTVLVPWLVPKPVPVIVTDVPTAPEVGDRLLMTGVTVKLTPLLATPFTVTTTFPVVAPPGTGTTMLVPLQLVGVPAVPLKVTVLVPCVLPKFVPVIVTDVPTAPDVGDRLLMTGVTVKLTPLLATPFAVTTTFPVLAPLGTGTTMLVALQLVGVPAVPLKVTVLVPCVAPKFVPVTVTDVPTAPEVGDRLLIVGVGSTVKLTPLLATPFTVTTTFPVVAPAGTGTTMLAALQLVGVAVVPLNATVLVPCVLPKFVPVIVTDVPTAPDVGDRLLMTGVTVKLTPLLATPLTVTTTFPVVAPLGTGTAMLVPLQLVGVPADPLNVTVLVPWLVPKPVPVIVTDVPTAPEVGERLLMLGPLLAALNAAMFAIQSLKGESVQVAAIEPAVLWTRSSSAYAAATPRSTRLVNPLPAVNVSPLPMASSVPQLKIKSPFLVVVAEPLDGLVPVPRLPAVTSSADEAARPLYSWMPSPR